MRQIYDFEPQPCETTVYTGTMATVIRLNIEEVQTEEGTHWECDEVCYNHPLPLEREKDYGGIVTAIVRSKYSADDMEAIINNYLLTKTAQHKAEWNAMQAWRALAKETAENILANESE